jgi:uncharacterized protein YjeT (DUF2065 family)
MFNGYNPEMMKNMMNPGMMKSAAEMMSNMSDDQIKQYLNAAGMGHMSPEQYRMMAGQMKNMPDADLERAKNNVRIY